ncbi:ArgP/LysG family DNA-binding transcriptional regulator [Acinetobacter sp. ANC 4470]|uniref:HTH-type transcriptional regulator ArgP n=1 Tax=Acinetobacter sp. ANC 4470 TaxID=1977881 RepID=UPI000A332C2C|nr:HTH-type transcriptional regulator ArgP [Acinetobacter sp. ANC 4470]OTG68145.1 ArgP/LysG family DNA-binding transcriptional regulator [Acinetobacter sp. ANC 4470]
MLNSKQCDAFLAVAETGSFELAAERLYITASAVTLRVQSLEKTLGHILILRERPCRVTQAGQSLLHYLQHSRLLEQNLLQNLTGQIANSSFYQINIATNDNSLTTWLLSTIQETLIDEKIVLHLKVADQTQTHHLLEAGLVNACISTEAITMKGCLAEPLGTMTYRMVATPQFVQKWFPNGINRENLKVTPAVIYNDRDQIHTDIILKHYGLTSDSYPHHYIPSSNAFAEAICIGLGFGMLPEYQIGLRLETAELVEILPQFRTEIMLYWHHWKRQSVALEKLTETLLQQAHLKMNQA